jgi:hypothetical protein
MFDLRDVDARQNQSQQEVWRLRSWLQTMQVT